MSYKTGAPKSGTETRRTLLAQTARDMSRSCGGRRPSAEAKCSSSLIGSQIPAVPCPRAATLHTAVLIAAFRCDAPARCGAFVDERCIAAGDCDAVCIFPRSKVGTPGAAIVPHTLVVPSPRATRRAIPRRAVGIDERARPWSRRSPRVLRGLELELIATLQAGVLIATLHRAAPTRVAGRSPMRGSLRRRRRRTKLGRRKTGWRIWVEGSVRTGRADPAVLARRSR